jgi:uncharacterized PurR-regulated membrane protein YhhQ (DUF165 family)
MRAALALSYVGLAVLANWLASKYVVHVPFTPYLAPAGVFCIGGVLVLRDWFQQIAGLWWSLALVYVAGLISYVAGVALEWTDLQKIAVASVVAFTVSETAEAVVFRSTAFFPGQFIGKGEMIALGTVLTMGRRALLADRLG